MEANNLADSGQPFGQRASAPHMPDSECEQIVYLLAKNCSFRSLKQSVQVLCPRCAQQIKKLLEPTKIIVKDIEILHETIGSDEK